MSNAALIDHESITELNRRREEFVGEDGTRWTVYRGRLLGLCMERAMLLGQTKETRQEKWPTLHQLSHSRYVRGRLDGGCA